MVPSGSDEPEPSSVTISEPFSSVSVTVWSGPASAIGFLLPPPPRGLTWTTMTSVSVAPPLSVTVSVITCEPIARFTVGLTPVGAGLAELRLDPEVVAEQVGEPQRGPHAREGEHEARRDLEELLNRAVAVGDPEHRQERREEPGNDEEPERALELREPAAVERHAPAAAHSSLASTVSSAVATQTSTPPIATRCRRPNSSRLKGLSFRKIRSTFQPRSIITTLN